jgi:cell division protein FtsI/penicillin-binding protein 2
MPRAVLGKVAAVVAIVGVLGFGLVKGGGSSAEPTVQAFLLAWQNGQYRDAAAMTTGRPAAVVGALAGAYSQLDAADLVMRMGAITQQGDTASVHFHAAVDLGSGGLRWGYEGTFAMRRTGAGWKVLWSPSVIVPGLRSGERFAVLTSLPSRAQIEDSAGHSLALPSLVYSIGVRPGSLADAQKTANALASVTRLDSSQIYGQIIAAPSRAFLGLIRLQPAAYARMQSKLGRVPGLVVVKQTERLFDSLAPVVAGSVGTETAEVLRLEGVPYRPGTTVGLSGLQAAYQRALTGTPTTEVVLQNKAGQQEAILRRWMGGPGTAVRTTLDGRVQSAADEALAHLPGSAAIVAIAPGSGRILAVAAHQAGGMPAVSPLAGHYEPGQAFTVISTAALLETGAVHASSPVPCRELNIVGGHHFLNKPAVVGLRSQPPFSVDFAHACGTAFAGLSLQLNIQQLASAAKKFGIGAAWDLKVASYPGTIGRPVGIDQIAATSVGGGDVRVSPLDMALAAGLVQSGTWHAPALVTGPDPAGVAPERLSPQVVSSLRTLMRSTVTKGAGGAAQGGAGPVYGQIGNSVLDPAAKGLRSAWFVGYQGKVAFAVIQFTKSANVSAAPLAGEFLRDVQG